MTPANRLPCRSGVGAAVCAAALLVALFSACAADDQETFNKWNGWYGEAWDAGGFLVLRADANGGQALLYPRGLLLQDPVLGVSRIIELSIDLRFADGLGAGGIAFSRADSLTTLYVLALDASGRWNLYRRATAETLAICDLETRIGERSLSPWRNCPHFRAEPGLENRLTIRFQVDRRTPSSPTILASAFLNGFDIATIPTDLPAERAIRFALVAFGSPDHESASVYFDDLEVVTRGN